MGGALDLLYYYQLFVAAKPRFWFHHLLQPGRGGPGAGHTRPLPGRQEDRP